MNQIIEPKVILTTHLIDLAIDISDIVSVDSVIKSMYKISQPYVIVTKL